jgi:hypothetical protein
VIAAFSIFLVARSEQTGSVIDPPEAPPDDFGSGGGGGGSWVTIATFWSSVEAHLAQAALEREDIDSLLLDEHVVATVAWYAGAVGGIKLQVRAEHAEVARAILKPMLGRSAPDPAVCPKCGSEQLIPLPRGRAVEWIDRATRGLISRLFGRPVQCSRCDQVTRVG